MRNHDGRLGMKTIVIWKRISRVFTNMLVVGAVVLGAMAKAETVTAYDISCGKCCICASCCSGSGGGGEFGGTQSGSVPPPTKPEKPSKETRKYIAEVEQEAVALPKKIKRLNVDTSGRDTTQLVSEKPPPEAHHFILNRPDFSDPKVPFSPVAYLPGPPRTPRGGTASLQLQRSMSILATAMDGSSVSSDEDIRFLMDQAALAFLGRQLKVSVGTPGDSLWVVKEGKLDPLARQMEELTSEIWHWGQIVERRHQKDIELKEVLKKLSVACRRARSNCQTDSDKRNNQSRERIEEAIIDLSNSIKSGKDQIWQHTKGLGEEVRKDVKVILCKKGDPPPCGK